ncbi:MAG: hypothetical protein JRI45_04925, partial [Deltaproteobacteria bacterium]|nr:hypothetical protein [Deltaproteobacteria bacterium]
MQGRPENILTVTEILNVLFKNKRLILGTVFVALFVGFLYCIMKSPVYLAE